MNYMKDIAKLLGVELEEEFYLEDVTDGYYFSDDNFKKVTFRLSDTGMFRKDKNTETGWKDLTCYLMAILTGRYTIVKKPWKPSRGLRYYYVTPIKTLDHTVFDSSSYWDVMAYTLGNCFRTKEEITPEALEETWQKCYGAYFQDDKQDGVKQ